MLMGDPPRSRSRPYSTGQREAAEAMIREVREDEPELADELGIEEISLVASAN
jgi:hypothetical protein